MSRPPLLSEDEINESLKEISFWTRKENQLVREIVADDFVTAIAIANSIAFIAECLDHHPDIFIYGWNKIRVTTTTHDRGGLTQLDFELAKRIENLKIIKKGAL